MRKRWIRLRANVQKLMTNWYKPVAAVVLPLLLLSTLVLPKTVEGRSVPKGLSQRKESVMQEALQYLKTQHPKADHVEILALAGWESEFTPRAKSHTGDYGLVQINCRIWKKSLALRNCHELFDVKTNIDAAVEILRRFRTKYKSCRGELAYACYYRGQRWRVNRQRCLKRTTSKKTCDGPLIYMKGVKGYKRMLRRNYRSVLVR